MKRIYLVLLIPILIIAFSPTAPAVDLNQKITLQLDEVPISTVLQSIAMQYDINIVQTWMVLYR